MPTRAHAIVIGVSSGGVEALGQLLPALPPTLRAAVMVVLHLPPDRPSLLSAIFAGACALPVKEAEDKEDVQPGHVYFAPPDYHLLVDRGPRLVLSFDPPVQFSRPAIDPLFQTAADVYGKRLWGIVLTGNSEDGADGLAAVHRAGGRCFVQDPRTAASPLMPGAALARVPGATSLPLLELARRLSAWPD
ncbi:chemotaxis protein CheB [Arenimonas sp. MALMAid1274]|uniref:chemotaxis protein CheB n=1 Tax=Arenimonas sp. MALMAid1274 TaxID=3411630 RepID=UPI003BA00E46